MRKQQLLLVLLLFCGVTLYAQTRVVTGMVKDSSGTTPLGYVSVKVKGKNVATTTAADGSFSINLPATATDLQISYVGYASQTFTVAPDQTSVNILLSPSAGNLSDVVVTALGITRQSKSLSYATQTVKTSELTSVRDANNVINSLQGKVANAVISQGSGGPGSGARIVLRGNRSIQGGNTALIVVDGVPILNETFSAAGSDFGSIQGSDGASNINPDDIESLTILRGASGAALYGSQAGNGVLVITTKKGRKDNTTGVSINSGFTVESPFALPKFQNEYGQGNAGMLDPTVGDSWGAKMTGQSYTNYLGKQSTYSPQSDNVKDFFRNGLTFNNSVGISGGNEKVQTYFSYTNNAIQGIVPKNDLIRHNINLRLSDQITKKLSLDAKVSYINQRIDNRPRTGEENSPVIDIYQTPRSVPLSDVKQAVQLDNLGVPEPTTWPSTLSSIYQNPYWMINQTAINENRNRVTGFITLKYQLTDWLSIATRANLDKILDDGEIRYSQGTLLWASQAGGYYSKYSINLTQQWYDAIISGNNNFAKDFKVNYNVGAIFQDIKAIQDQTSADGLNVTNKFSLNYGTNLSTNDDAGGHQTQSAFAQATVSWKDGIFLDGSFRNDWDSRLPSPYTYAYYSTGLSAVISDLVTLPKALSFLKASASYAEVGNGGQEQVRFNTYSYGQGAGNGFLSRGLTLAIPGLKPEIVKNFEAGIEARFIKDRIGFSLSYYKSNSVNQLLQISLPVATGYSSKYINAGNIENHGLELVVNGTPVQSKNFSWDVTLNASLNRNKIKSISPDLSIVYLGGGYGRAATPVVQVGGSYGDLLSFKWATNDKGQYLVNNSGVPISTADQEYIGNFNPKENLGFTNTFNYKGFSLRVLLDGRIGGTLVSGTEMNLAFSGITEGTLPYREGGWKLNGIDTSGSGGSTAITAQQFWQTASGKRYGIGQFFAYNATSFRVREVSFGYAIPVPKSSFIKGLNLSLVARNLFWLYRGKSILDIPGVGKRTMPFDPDMSLGNGNYQGVEYGTLPSTRSLGVNLKISF